LSKNPKRKGKEKMRTLKEDVERQIKKTVVELSTIQRNLETLETFPELEEVQAEKYFSNYSRILYISAASFEDAGQIAKQLLPLVKDWMKDFGEYSGRVKLYGTLPDGCKIELSSPLGDSCQVKIVETVEHVPAQVRTSKIYKLVGNCNPLMKGQENEESQAN